MIYSNIPFSAVVDASRAIERYSRTFERHSRAFERPSRTFERHSRAFERHSRAIERPSKTFESVYSGLFNKLCQKASVLHPPTTHSPTLYIQDNRVVMLPISIIRPTL